MQGLVVVRDILGIVAYAFMMLVIIQFIISLLFAFNVVNVRNQFLTAFHSSIDAFLFPILAPIRKRLPPTGAIDFSPLVLIIAMSCVLRLLDYFITGR